MFKYIMLVLLLSYLNVAELQENVEEQLFTTENSPEIDLSKVNDEVNELDQVNKLNEVDEESEDDGNVDELGKLGKIFHKVDEQVLEDGLVTEEELTKWLQTSKKRSNLVDTMNQFMKYDKNGDGAVSWDENKVAFENGNDNQEESLKVLIAHDEKRFNVADQDGDARLSLGEFSAFMFPEDHEHMISYLVSGAIEDIDKDNDGLISLEEYLADSDAGDFGEPDWVNNDKEEFIEIHDKNKDGKMDRDEVKSWILPRDQLVAEARRLISASDADGDGKVSKEEMLEKSRLFIRSHLTDFEDIVNHDEL